MFLKDFFVPKLFFDVYKCFSYSYIFFAFWFIGLNFMSRKYFPPIRTAVVVLLSFIVALVLMLIALPSWLEYLRPQLVVLTLLYWLFYLPQRVGIFTAWLLGLVLDVLSNVTLGEHALILVVIAYIALYWQARINFFAHWQKIFLVFLLVSLYFLPQFYIGFTGNGVSTFDVWLYWLSPVVSAIIWPYLVSLLDLVRKRFRL